MKKLILIFLALPLLVSAQTKDTLISKKDIATLTRNMYIIQTNLHKVDMSSRLRDALDSIYMVNVLILTKRDTVKGGKKP
jgi:hypothetical protein